ncbi:hypothetical protein [Kitasatospora viridis]|uniref:Uncharacterized protein n=1 Tax=Kitasatospora viridis TaxID=281105 RepID=A0A561S9Q6_9ACTN|nr:hypothetical protein [Kitasatospora viridis]TWF71584.1 hypothetical protein FHX73_19214 [Kitasatospora viridis]
MSERRNRRRLHARARALGVPLEQVPRRGGPSRRPDRSSAAPFTDTPRWADTWTPYREPAASQDDDARWDDPTDFEPHRSHTPRCCETVLTRKLTDGGTVVMLTTHQAECPIWSTRL